MMNKLRLSYNNHGVQFDRKYGCNNRTGWSIYINGRFRTDIERYLIVAIWKTIRRNK